MAWGTGNRTRSVLTGVSSLKVELSSCLPRAFQLSSDTQQVYNKHALVARVCPVLSSLWNLLIEGSIDPES